MEQQIHMGINKRPIKLVSVVFEFPDILIGHRGKGQLFPPFLSYLNTDRNPQAEDPLCYHI